MKTAFLYLFALSILTISCGSDNKSKKDQNLPVQTEQTDASDLIAKGKDLYSKNGCVACHQEDQKVIGPAIKDISKIYTEQNGDLISFLKGESDAIVDTDAGQVAVMQANIPVTKALPLEDLKAIEAYILSVK